MYITPFFPPKDVTGQWQLIAQIWEQRQAVGFEQFSIYFENYHLCIQPINMLSDKEIRVYRGLAGRFHIDSGTIVPTEKSTLKSAF